MFSYGGELMGVAYPINVDSKEIAAKSLWRLLYDADAGSISVDASALPLSNSVNLSGNADFLAKDDNDNVFIASSKNGTQQIRKYNSDLVLDGNWATAGTLTVGTSESSADYITSIKLTASGLLYVARRSGAGQANIYCYDSSGTLKWMKDYSSDRTWGIIDSMVIASDGSLFLNARNDSPLRIKHDGTVYSYTYPLALDDSAGGVWVDNENKLVYFSNHRGGSSRYLTQYTWGSPTANPVKVWQQSMSALSSQIFNMLFHSNGGTYLCGANYKYPATDDVVKIDPADATILLGWSSTGGEMISGMDELPNGEIVITGYKDAAEANNNLWILNENLVEQLGYSVAGSDSGYSCLAQSSTVSTGLLLSATYSKKLVAIGGDEVWYESSAGTMEELAAANNDIDTIEQLSMIEAYQKVFIANKTNLKVADFANTKVTTGAVGANPPDRSNILTGNTSGAIMIVDYITSLAGACIIYGTRTTVDTFVDTETVTGTDDDGNAISFVLTANEVSPPHWYGWTVYGGSATYGAMPTKANLAALYRGRLVLSGHSNYPHQWYMSRVSNPWDWKYSTNDPLTAVAGNNTDAGEVGDIITALIPFRDDYLVFGCATSIWLLRGDPACGGSLDRISDITGMFGAQSWCWGPNNVLYFIGNNGLYRALPPTFESIEPVSVATMPNLISDWGLDLSLHRVMMEYDRRRNGIVICRTTLSDGSSDAFWYDIRSDGFFPESYPDECGPFSMFFYEAEDDDYRRLLFGSNDSYLRYFDDAKKDDSGSTTTDTAISSHVALPIFEAGAENKEGKITSLTFTLAGGAAGGSFSDTDGLTYEIYAGDDPETVLENIKDRVAARESGTLAGTGRKNRIRKRVRGHAIGIRLSNTTAGETWAVERIISNNIPAGDE